MERLDELVTELDAIRADGRDAYLAEWRTRLAAEQRLAAAAGMRNILVLGYLDVDDEAVWNALDRLDDLRSFAASAQHIARRVASDG